MIGLTSFLKPKKPKQTVIFIDIAGRQIEILLIRNKQAKRLTLRQNLSGGNFKLSMPIRGTIAQAEDFCGQHTGWIADKSVNMQDMIMFEHDQHIPLRGGQVKLIFLDKLRGQTQKIENELHVTGGTDYAPRRLTTWLKAEAKADILIAIEKYQPLLDVKHSKLTIRDTKSRWGSCSSSKALSFSWRLVLAPPDVLDYVVAHELAHILEMNHSATFWAHVDKVCPHMKDSRNWLKTKGGQLHQIRAK